MDPDRITLSVSETCQALGVSRAALYAAWQHGKGPPRLKFGRRTMIRVDALEAWLRESEAAVSVSERREKRDPQSEIQGRKT